MRFSIRSGALAATAAIALAACGGNGAVPSSPGAFNPMSDAMAKKAKPANCHTKKYQPGWIFAGPCTIGTLAPTGGTTKLLAYKGYTVNISFPANDAQKGTLLVLADATGKGDITGTYKGHPFPVDKGTFLYVQAVNGGVKGVEKKIVLKPRKITVSVTNAGTYAGPKCGIYYFTGTGWSLVETSNVKGHKLTLSISSTDINSLGGLPKGPLYLSLSCKK